MSFLKKNISRGCLKWNPVKPLYCCNSLKIFADIEDLLIVTKNKRSLLISTLKIFSGIFTGTLSLEACLGLYQTYIMNYFAKIASRSSIFF